MYEVILLILLLVVFCLASFTDLKTREVPDWLNYSLIAAALGIRAIYSVDGGWEILGSGVLGLAAMFLIGCAFYYSGQWGGGDSKLLMGSGAALGIAYPFSMASLTLLWYFVLVLLVGAGYGLLWMMVLAVRHRDTIVPAFQRFWQVHRSYHWLLLGLVLLSLASSFWVVAYFWILGLVLVVLFYLLALATIIEKVCFVKKVRLATLTEGDWLAEDVRVRGKVLVPKKTIEKKDLQQLKAHQITAVIIKEGIPFVPSFLLAFIVFLVAKIWWLP